MWEMAKKSKKQAVIYIAVILFSIAFIIVGNAVCRPPIFDEGGEEYYRAKVISVGEPIKNEYYLDDGETMVSSENVVFRARFLSGPYKGDEADCLQTIDIMYEFGLREVRVGDSVLVSRPQYEVDEDVGWIFIEFNRIGKIIFLVAVFLLLIAAIGRKKGLSTILSLIFTVLSIFLVYIPAILKGYNVYVMSVIICAFSVFTSLILIGGWNTKTICAIIGNLIGVAVAGVLTAVMSNAFGMSGLVDENYIMLTQLDTPIDLKAIIWGGVLVGAMGAVMDVSMSIASAMNELSETMRNKSFFNMLRSGMNIGRDAIGTMTNTLILAYIGGALATVLLLVAYNKNILYLFNMEMILAEILSSIVGSIGILAAVPATAFISAYIFNRPGRSKNAEEESE